MLLLSTDARQTTDYTSEKFHARAFSTRSLVVLLGSDIGDTTPGAEHRKLSEVSFYIIRIDK